MAHIATDVVLLPDDAMTDRVIEFNRRISREYSAQIELNRENCLPHISLAMGAVEQRDVGAIQDVLERLARETPIRQLTAVGVQNPGEQKASFLEIERTEGLQRLHERVMQEMNPFFSYEVTDAMFCDDIVAQTSVDWVRHYPEKASYENFRPHITLGYGPARPSFSFPVAFHVRALALCHLGNHCTCRKILGREAYLVRREA